MQREMRDEMERLRTQYTFKVCPSFTKLTSELIFHSRGMNLMSKHPLAKLPALPVLIVDPWNHHQHLFRCLRKCVDGMLSPLPWVRVHHDAVVRSHQPPPGAGRGPHQKSLAQAIASSHPHAGNRAVRTARSRVS